MWFDNKKFFSLLFINSSTNKNLNFTITVKFYDNEKKY